jgi:hypothetical protein
MDGAKRGCGDRIAVHKGVPLVILHPDSVTAETLAALGKRPARRPDTAGAVALRATSIFSLRLLSGWPIY